MAETQITPAAPTPTLRDGPVGSTLDVDSLIAQHLGADESMAAPPASESKPETPVETKDTPAGQPEPEVEIGDTPEEIEEGVETGDEPEEEEAEGTLGEDEDDELDALLAATEEPEDKPKDTPEETFLPEFDRVKFLQKHPELEAPYKHMQAAFSRKMAEAAKVRSQSEQVREQAEAMQQQLLAFQERLKDDKGFEEFLVQAALNRPEVVERAYERAVTLNEDEGKKKEYLREQDLAERESRIKAHEQQEAAAAHEKRVTQVVNFSKRVAEKLGLTSEGDFEVVDQYVANRILQNKAATGNADLTNEEIVVAVRQAAKALAGKAGEVKKAARLETQRKNLKAVQDKVRSPKRPAAPKSGTPIPTEPKIAPIRNAPKQERLFSWIDEQLGVES